MNITIAIKSMSVERRLLKIWGNSSQIAVTTVSKIVNCESSPKVKSIKKKRTAHKGDTGNLLIASGYAMKARPKPVWIYIV